MTTRRSLLLTAILCVLTGCMGYSSYPDVEANYGATGGPNTPASEAVMTAALRHVVSRFPPGGPRTDAPTARDAASAQADFPLIVNLPIGTRKAVYDRVVQAVGPHARPMSADTASSRDPVYSVSRVWVRERTATVDVLRPMPELTGPGGGKPVYQMITVRLEGGLRPWRVIHARVWDPTGADQPIPFNIPDVDRHDEFERATEQLKSPKADAAPPEKGAAAGWEQFETTDSVWMDVDETGDPR